jgi:alpha-N-arabinofuranosidase
MVKEGILIKPFAINLKAVAPTSTLFHRQQHRHFTATTILQYKPSSENELAGMVCYQSERFHYLFGITRKGKQDYLVLQRTERGISTILASTPIESGKPLSLQINAKGDNYRFNYATDGKTFHNLGGTVSGDILSTNVAGGFTGNLIGLHATTKNDAFPE